MLRVLLALNDDPLAAPADSSHINPLVAGTSDPLDIPVAVTTQDIRDGELKIPICQSKELSQGLTDVLLPTAREQADKSTEQQAAHADTVFG